MAATAKETMAWAAENVPGFGFGEAGYWAVGLGLDGKISLAGYAVPNEGAVCMRPQGVYGRGDTIDEAFESWRHQTEEWLDERLEQDHV